MRPRALSNKPSFDDSLMDKQRSTEIQPAPDANAQPVFEMLRRDFAEQDLFKEIF